MYVVSSAVRMRLQLQVVVVGDVLESIETRRQAWDSLYLAMYYAFYLLHVCVLPAYVRMCKRAWH